MHSLSILFIGATNALNYYSKKEFFVVSNAICTLNMYAIVTYNFFVSCFRVT